MASSPGAGPTNLDPAAAGEAAAADPARARALALLKRHGWNATSFQILEPGFRYWFDGDGDGGDGDRGDNDGCVAFVDTGHAWVAAGAPIAAPARLADVARGFIAAARAAGRRASFFATEQRFEERFERRFENRFGVGDPSLESLRLGEQPIWDPADWAATIDGAATLRAQLRRARAKGVGVRAIPAAELADATTPTRIAIDALIHRWQAGHPLPPMGFLVQVHAFSHLSERRCFVAERAGRVVGFLAAVPIYARAGWLFEDLLRDPTAPNGTAELLFDAAMRAAGDEGSRYVTLGLVPLAGSVGRWLSLARRSGGGLYDFEGLRAFKAKLRPRDWVSIFLSYPDDQGAARTILDALAAFAHGRLLRFGLATLARGPAVVVRLLALLLCPWTVVLALADSRRWFPSPQVQLAWVLFDAGLAIALYRLGRRWRAGADAVIASLVTADAALTLIEAVTFNLRRRPLALGDLVVSTIAIAGPTLAAVVLWRGRTHRRSKN